MTDAKRPVNATLQLPPSVGARYMVATLSATNWTYACAAALGLCWRGAGRVKARWTPADPGAYAEAVFDELMAREGVGFEEVLEAGGRAFSLIADSLVTSEALEEAQGNSEAPAESSNG